MTEIPPVPPWLEALVDQRMALIEQMLPPVPNRTMIMTPVRDPEEDTPTALDHWERSCDNCGKYCPPNDEFYTGHTVRTLSNGQPVYITFGVCKNHKW